jgi:hypothetical protein
MTRFKILRVGFPVLMALAGIQTASASLILETFQQISGTGLGTVPTLVTFQNNGTETGCFGSNGAGSALSGGTCTPGGDTKTGNSQAQLQPLSAAGITGAVNFGLIFNAVQPASGPLEVTNITVAFYDPTGKNLLFESSGLFCQTSAGGPIVSVGSGCLLTSTGSGTGNSGFLVILDANQQALATAAGAFSSTGNMVGVSAAAGGAGGASAGGGETIFLANSGGVSTVPEPISLALTGAGLLGLSLFRRRVVSR